MHIQSSIRLGSACIALLMMAPWLTGCVIQASPLSPVPGNGTVIAPATATAISTMTPVPTHAVPTHTGEPPPVVLPTAVEYIMAHVNVNVRSGPGTGYPPVSFLAEGQIGAVHGISADDNWWYVLCPDNTLGCWITADPSLTQPTVAPGNPPTATPLPKPTTVPTTVPTTGPTSAPIQQTGEATVEALEVRILESFPVQVQAIVRGTLPDACAYIDNVRVQRESTTFRIQMTTARPAGSQCAQVITPFEETVGLDVAGLPAGQYDVRINELVEPFTLSVDNAPITPEPGAGPIEDAGEAVVERVEAVYVNLVPPGVNAVVYGTLPDACAYIESVRVQRESTTFRIQMTTARHPNQRCAPVPTPFQEVVALDVLDLPTGDYTVAVNHVSNSFRWTAVETAQPAAPTGVTDIVALDAVEIHSGPGTQYPVVGRLFAGEYDGVAGISLDGQWWRIQCAIDTGSNCWVTADPGLTQPAAPGL